MPDNTTLDYNCLRFDAAHHQALGSRVPVSLPLFGNHHLVCVDISPRQLPKHITHRCEQTTTKACIHTATHSPRLDVGFWHSETNWFYNAEMWLADSPQDVPLTFFIISPTYTQTQACGLHSETLWAWPFHGIIDKKQFQTAGKKCKPVFVQ